MNLLQVIKYKMIYIYILELQSERERRYISLSSTYFFFAGYIDGLLFTDPKAHTLKTAVCNINVGFSWRHRHVLIRYLASQIVLN